MSKTMNVTREVVTDLLPIYFSGEASGDTNMLVEDYFHQDPDFERIARSAATPLETLRAAAPIAASREKEKRDLEGVFLGMRRRQWLFGLSLFLTLAPLASALGHGHFVSEIVRDGTWNAFQWSMAAGLWFLYFSRMPWRTKGLVFAIYFTLIPIPFVLHSVFAGGRVLEFAIIWIFAAWMWFGYFTRRAC